MQLFRIDPRDATPIYAQLDRAIRAAVASGRLAAGDRLPTVRELAVDLRVNANTVARVYTDLERAGVIETRRGVGSFVAATPAEARPEQVRASALEAFTTHVLAEAGAHGFTLDELLAALTARRASSAR